MRAGVSGAAALSLCFLLLAASFGRAQSSPPSASPPSAPAPLPGFVPPYEITKIVRSAGFSPLAPPRREGTTYVLRATDFRGILMRVVVDARSGAIRAVNRIVPPGPYGAVMAGPYGEPPPYGYGRRRRMVRRHPTECSRPMDRRISSDPKWVRRRRT